MPEPSAAMPYFNWHPQVFGVRLLTVAYYRVETWAKSVAR